MLFPLPRTPFQPCRNPFPGSAPQHRTAGPAQERRKEPCREKAEGRGRDEHGSCAKGSQEGRPGPLHATVGARASGWSEWERALFFLLARTPGTPPVPTTRLQQVPGPSGPGGEARLAPPQSRLEPQASHLSVHSGCQPPEHRCAHCWRAPRLS